MTSKRPFVRSTEEDDVHGFHGRPSKRAKSDRGPEDHSLSPDKIAASPRLRYISSSSTAIPPSRPAPPHWDLAASVRTNRACSR